MTGPIARSDDWFRSVFVIPGILIALGAVTGIPVQLLNDETSSSRLLGDSVRGLVDVLRIKRNHLRGWYRNAAPEAIAQQDFEQVRRAASGGARG